MTRLFAYEDHSYTSGGEKFAIKKGEVADIDEATAFRLAAAHPEKLLLLDNNEEPPKLESNEYQTTVVLRPGYDRSMIPGSSRISREKMRLLRKAKGRSRHAHLTITS